jgi:hypothetical protein
MSLKTGPAIAGMIIGTALLCANSALAAGVVPEAGPLAFTTQMGLLFVVLLLVIALFIFEWVRVDVVGLLMMVLLPILGLVTPQEAISGLSSNAVVAIIAVIIIGAAWTRQAA